MSHFVSANIDPNQWFSALRKLLFDELLGFVWYFTIHSWADAESLKLILAAVKNLLSELQQACKGLFVLIQVVKIAKLDGFEISAYGDKILARCLIQSSL